MGKSIYNRQTTMELSKRDIAKGINLIKDTFEARLSSILGLVRVPGPLFLSSSSHLNDRLSGKERPVTFNPPYVDGPMEIVQSLAKWKRLALKDYGFQPGEGIYVDMRAIRQDEIPDRTHSLLVDQWDWEISITRENRQGIYLRQVVRDIYRAITHTEREVHKLFPWLEPILPEDIQFVSTHDLDFIYPGLSPKKREDAMCKEKKAVCLIGIGHRHDSRSWEYDDWDLNCDILVWNPTLGQALELSSMGIRVDATTLRDQAPIDIPDTPYFQGILDDSLPLSIGGGIGQSRMYMFLLRLKDIHDAHLYTP